MRSPLPIGLRIGRRDTLKRNGTLRRLFNGRQYRVRNNALEVGFRFQAQHEGQIERFLKNKKSKSLLLEMDEERTDFVLTDNYAALCVDEWITETKIIMTKHTSRLVELVRAVEAALLWRPEEVEDMDTSCAIPPRDVRNAGSSTNDGKMISDDGQDLPGDPKAAEPPLNPASRLLDDMEKSGDLVAEGTFTLSREAAKAKIRDFQFKTQYESIPELVQAACFKNAKSFSVEIEATRIILTFDGEPFSMDDISSMHQQIFTTAKDRAGLARRQLALGVNMAMGFNPRQIHLVSGSRGKSRPHSALMHRTTGSRHPWIGTARGSSFGSL